MNDLKQEYLDKKYSYLDDNSFNVKPKASKKRSLKRQIISINIIVPLLLMPKMISIMLVIVTFAAN